MNVFSRKAIFWGAALAASAAWADANLASGTDTARYLSPGEYRTLLTGHLRIRYPVAHEAEARLIAARSERWIDSLERRVGFRAAEPYTIFLTDRDFGNAFFMGAEVGSGRHELVPLRLTSVSLGSDVFQFAGFEESAFDVIAHESTHHLQGEMGRPWLESWLGPVLDPDNIFTPSWIWEGWAVHQESQSLANKGRMRAAYFGALLRSGLQGEGRGLESYDFSRDNPAWVFSSAQYLSGASFIDFLARRYGEAAVNAFVRGTGQMHFESDYWRAFGKGFADLLREFNAELAQMPAPPVPEGRQPVWARSAGELRGFERLADGSIIFVASFPDDEPYWYRLGPDGRERARWPVRSVLQGVTRPAIDPPLEVTGLADAQSLLFLSSVGNRDNSAYRAGIWRMALDGSPPARVLDAPDARTFTASPDGRRLWLGEEHSGRISVREADLATGRSREVTALEGAVSIAHLRLSPSGKRLAFSAIRQQGTWDIYVLELATGEIRLAYASAGQDLRPRWGADDDRLYFISDRDGKFQVYSVDPTRGGELCREADARWIVRDFAVAADGALFTIDRQGRTYEVLRGPRLARCETSSRPVAVASLHAGAAKTPFEGPSLSESGWSTLVPATRAILPSYYGHGSGWDLLGVVAGESPYKKWNWAAVADFMPRFRNDYSAGLTIGTQHLYPFDFNFGVATGSDVLGRYYGSRHLVTGARLGLPLWNHRLTAQWLRFDPQSGKGWNPRLQGFELRHDFSSTVSNALSAGTQRGLGLTTSAALFPAWAGSALPVAMLRADQVVHVPWLISTTHDFRLGLSELWMNRNVYALAGGARRGWRASVQPSAYASALVDPLTDRTLSMRGFSDLTFSARRVFGADVSYAVPLNFLRSGSMNLMDRTWFNVALSGVRVGPYWNALVVPHNEGDFAGHAYHASVGAFLAASLLAFDHDKFLTTSLVESRRLTDDRAWNFDWNISANIDY